MAVHSAIKKKGLDDDITVVVVGEAGGGGGREEGLGGEKGGRDGSRWKRLSLSLY